MPACARSPGPAVTAAEVERTRCPGGGDDAALVNDAAVIGAHPMYSRVESKMGSENRVSGTTLIIRPTRSVSPDELTRALQCHSARALLGQGDPAKLLSDPYWVPDSWLEISVAKEDETNYAVSLRADTIAKNIELYSRATSYAESHGSKLQ